MIEAVEPASAAGRWFAVRAEYERIGRARMAWLAAKAWVVGLVTWGLTLGDFDPKRFCDVLVIRHDTGAVIASYDYEHLSAASAHVDRLRTRLDSVHVFDFCRDLGISTEEVVGPGASIGSQASWTAVEARLRRVR